MQAGFDPYSYIIVVLDCHGRDIPTRFIDGVSLGCFKISASGDSGYLAYHDDHVSHAIYTTCAEYNSQHHSGEEAALTLGEMLRSSRLAKGGLTIHTISKANGCPVNKIFKTSRPTYDKLFSFTASQTWERENFGIFIVGGCNSVNNTKGVNHNPPANIKDAVFTGTKWDRALFPGQAPEDILLSTVTQYLKRTYNVNNVIIVDWSCRHTTDDFTTFIGRTMSGEAQTHTPMETGDTPVRVSASAYRCPHPCPVCDKKTVVHKKGGNLLQNSKKSRSRSRKYKNKKSKGRHY